MGMRALRDIDLPAATDAPFALAFRAAGLIPLGRTNTPGAGSGGNHRTAGLRSDTQSVGSRPLARRIFGRIGRRCRGAHSFAAAHANDISGSIRIPASLCGLVGLKPTRGRVIVSAGDQPVGMSAEGVVTRSVRDTAALVDHLSWRSPWWPAPPLARPLAAEVAAGIGPLRVGVWTEAFNGAAVDAASAAAATDAAVLLADMGCNVDVSAPAVLSSDELWEVAKTAMAIAAASDAAGWKDRIGHALGEADLEPRTWGMVQAGQAVSAPEAMALIEQMQHLASAAFEWFEEYDLLVTPTTAGPATLLGEYVTNYVSGLGSAFAAPDQRDGPAGDLIAARMAG